ncbi:MAG: DegT/DnrJ/EryC1/StrS family aminotransferase [Candidatus Riflebacteria bacterium]|nr:DegT/DnrJ/EryC1/StrS family aminotransferase [Candidatus Riflebacteria bacterium]
MDKVDFYRHALQEEDVEAVAEVLHSIFLTTGPKTAAFEKAMAEFLSVRHVIGLTSCTTALFLCLKALDIGEGDEVITTPMTFIATANAILHAGATPVFVDVEPDTGNLDVERIEAAVTPRTRAVMPVHLYGSMVDMARLSELCRRRGLRLIEDAAHATEAERDGIRPGQKSDAACLSFYATKNLTCGEGGAVAVNDEAVAEKLGWLRLHGMTKSAADRYHGKYVHWDMVGLGYKANMPDILAALLLGQLPRLERQLERREAIARRYEDGFADFPAIRYPRVPAGARGARHLFTIWVSPERRDEILWRLQDRGIGVAVNYRAIHLLTYYSQRFGFRRGAFPVAERIGDSTLTLPLYPGLPDEAVDTVIRAVREVAGQDPR